MLAQRYKPWSGPGYPRAFNPPYAPLVDRVEGCLEEALHNLWEVPGRGHNKTSKDPETPRDHVIRVTDNLRAHPYGFAWYTAAPDNAPQYLQRV
jgi:hypothetical protein